MKFLKQVKAEMSKVVWPSKNKTILYTIIVIVVSLFVAYYMSLFDFVFLKYGIKSLLS
jgi:preprotein translocase subunit SecE